MLIRSLENLTSRLRALAAADRVSAVIFSEDGVELESTLRHHLALGFDPVIVIDGVGEKLPTDLEDRVLVLPLDFRNTTQVAAILQKIIAASGDGWVYYGYNAEYLFFPYSEYRSIRDVAIFMEEERRGAVFTSVVDLYPGDLARFPGGVARDDAWLDSAGYYSAKRYLGPEMQARQVDLFGGLKWRHGEHIPWEQRRADRVSLFKAAPKLKIDAELRFSEAEYNTYCCPWHNNLTLAVASFRTAKALMHNPHSRAEIDALKAPHSVPFSWSSQQLLDLGFMEPGQWF